MGRELHLYWLIGRRWRKRRVQRQRQLHRPPCCTFSVDLYLFFHVVERGVEALFFARDSTPCSIFNTKDTRPLHEVVGLKPRLPCKMRQEGVSSSAAIGADETIYVGANEGKLYAFAPDGAVRWHFSTPGSGIVSSPAIGAACMPWAGREKRETRGRPPSSPPPKDATISERIRYKLKLPENREQYPKREQSVEPVFGQIKEARGLRQFLLRGLDKVSALWQLECAAHNLLKLYRAGVGLQPTG